MGHAPELTRRSFLRVAGGAAAFAVVGGTLGTGVSPASAAPLGQPTGLLLQTAGATSVRHARHIRQYLDGYDDTPWDSMEDCERPCTRQLTDHRLPSAASER
ncbi:MAG: hypothetical protein HY907_02405 [Deltaproteobacteria bacterium]|nr:hypothetical protein [Deltaproteobacteria bacterium]